MSETLTESAPPRDAPKPRRSVTVVVLVVVVAIALAAAGWLIARGTPSSSGPNPSQAVASVQGGCNQWAANENVPDGTSRCAAMSQWMLQQLQDGNRTPGMLWGTPGSMAAACRDWTTTPSASGTTTGDPGAWCDQMVAWMQLHSGSWANWMMDGGMMRG